MTSPEPDNTDSTADPYWQARQQLALAARQLNESLISADIPPERALELSGELSRLTASLNDLPQVRGLTDMVGRRRGTVSIRSWGSLSPWLAEATPVHLI